MIRSCIPSVMLQAAADYWSSRTFVKSGKFYTSFPEKRWIILLKHLFSNTINISCVFGLKINIYNNNVIKLIKLYHSNSIILIKLLFFCFKSETNRKYSHYFYSTLWTGHSPLLCRRARGNSYRKTLQS